MTDGKTIVLGAGVVGVMTAYWLSEAGVDVLVVDREAAPAMGCSHANAGIVALGHAEAWGSPAAPLDLVSSFLGLNPALKVTRIFDMALWQWGLRFLTHCSPTAFGRNSQSLLRLCEYSASLLREIGDSENIDYHRNDRGALYLFRKAAKFAQRIKQIERDPKASGLLQVLTADELIAREPSLAGIYSGLAGGLYSPRDISGDCKVFTQSLAGVLKESGRVRFQFDTDVTGLRRRAGNITAVETSNGDLHCSSLVVAAGNATKPLLALLGVKAPIYPVKGYSATYPILHSDAVPQHPAIDETHLVSYARYGDRLRMTSIAEFAGYDSRLPPARLDLLDHFAMSISGEGLDYDHASYWTGLRPSTPASTPYLGKVNGCDNLWINAGHGQLGWSMSAGSGKVVADLVTGRQPELSGISARARWLDAF